MPPRTETVKNVVTYPVDLDGGAPLGPGEVAEDVRVNTRHNAGLLERGEIKVVGQPDEGRAAAITDAQEAAREGRTIEPADTVEETE